MFVLCLVILLLSVLPETNYWTKGNTLQTVIFWGILFIQTRGVDYAGDRGHTFYKK